MAAVEARVGAAIITPGSADHQWSELSLTVGKPKPYSIAEAQAQSFQCIELRQRLRLRHRGRPQGRHSKNEARQRAAVEPRFLNQL